MCIPVDENCNKTFHFLFYCSSNSWLQKKRIKLKLPLSRDLKGKVILIFHQQGTIREFRAPTTLTRFQTKTFAPFSKRFASTLILFVSFSPVHTAVSNAFIPSVRMLKWTQHMHISIYRPAKLKPHGSVCPPFWILTVEWSGTRSCLFWWRHRFQIASFSPSTLENSVFKKRGFQIVPLWRAFRIAPFLVIVFRVVVWTIAVSGAKQLRFHLKTAKCGLGLTYFIEMHRSVHCTFSASFPLWNSTKVKSFM